MAEIKDFLSPEAIKQQDDYIKKLGVIKQGYTDAAKQSLALLTNIEKISVTSKNTDEVQKRINTNTEKATKINRDLKNIEVEREKVQKQLTTILSKNLIAQEKTTKILQKGRVALQEKNKETKREALLARAQEGSYNKINIALLQNIDKWKKLTVNQRENTREGKLLTRTIQQQDAQLKKLDSQIGRSQRHVGNYGKALGGVARNLLGAFGVVGGVAMFARVMRGAFGTIRSFTKENAVLAGVLGKTREEVEDLTDKAVQLGAIYPVTASEVVKLQVSYARLGFTMVEINNLTEATILGSIALNAGLDETATLVGAVVKAYSDLGTADAGKIIDQLTLSTQRSSLSFSSLETALPKVAGAANAMGESLEGTLSKLAIAQDATLDASIAGTSLRNVYLEITKQGLTYDEALDKIQNSSNRLSTAFDLFGKRGAIVGLALADNREKAEELKTELAETGDVAERVAKEQMATLDGAIKGLGSSWEKLVLSFRNSEGVFSRLIRRWSDELDVFSSEYLSFWEKRIGNIPILGQRVVEKNKAFNKALSEVNNAANRVALQEAISKNSELLKENDEFQRDFTKATRARFESLKQTEQDEAKRKKIAEQQAKVERLAAISEASEKEQEEFRKQSKKRNDDTLKMAEDLRKMKSKNAKDERDDLKDFVDSQGELEIDKLKEWNKEKIEIAQTTYDNEVDARIEANKKIIKEDEKRAEQERQIAENLKDAKLELAASGVMALFELNDIKFEKELEDLEREKESVLSNDSLTKEERIRIEEDYDKKAGELKEKQAKSNKIAALIEAAINTALGVTGALSNPVTIPLVPYIIAQGAISAALIAAQPIPEFAKGTDSAPSKGLFGEKGAELMRTMAGEFVYADKPTVFSGSEYKGAKIWNAKETSDIMSGLGSGIVKGKNIDELINITLAKNYERGFDKMASEFKRGNKEIVRELKNNNYSGSYQNTVTKRSGNTIKRYHNQFN